MTARSLPVVLALVMLACVAPPARADTLDQQRADFLAALDAIRAGNQVRGRALTTKLQGYVLHGYLEYELLKDRVASTATTELHDFLERNPHAPIEEAVRKQWLRKLAARGEWNTFLTEYRNYDDDPELQCLRLDQLLRVSDQQAALMGEIEILWRTGKRLPGACDAVFAAWHKAGHMTT
jgi:soluble lytic murein transglycosylase